MSRTGRTGRRRAVLTAVLVLLASVGASHAAATPVGAEEPPPPPSFAGVWEETSTVDLCTPDDTTTCYAASYGNQPKRTYRLSGACDGVGPCLVELLAGWGREWTDKGCATGPDFTLRNGLLNTFRVTFPAAAEDPVKARVVSVVSLSPPAGYDYELTAHKVAPADADPRICVPPNPPTGVTAVPGNASATVSWTASDPDGALPVTEYVVLTSTGPRCTTSGATSCTVNGLANGTPVWFWVVARSGEASKISARSSSVTPTRCGQPAIVGFFDIGGGHPFCGAIEYMSASKISTGFADLTFRPTLPLTRQAVAAMLFRFWKAPATFAPPSTPTYTDIPTTHPFYRQIEWLASQPCGDSFSGPTFDALLTVKRAEIARCLAPSPLPPSFVVPVTPTFNDLPPEAAGYAEIEWLAEEGITTGYADGGFHPDAPLTRQAAAAFFHRVAASLAPTFPAPAP